MISFWKKTFVIVTHDGTFHTDDVFACAAISLLNKDKKIKIIRTRDEKEFAKADCLLDVGGEYDESKLRFDHHQKGGAGERENGIPYASFGLVWKRFGSELSGSYFVSNTIDERLVSYIDAVDNGFISRDLSEISAYSVVDFISSLRPTWEEDEACIDRAFERAVDFAKTIILRSIAQAKSSQSARSILEDAYTNSEDKRVVLIQKEYPGWYEVMAQYPEPLYVVYERSNGSWGVKGVRNNPADFEIRKPLPEEWAGLRGTELQKVTGINDAIFCHSGRFLIVSETKESALKLAQKAILL